MKITVAGGGAWGTTLANIAAKNGHDTSLWCFEKNVEESINSKSENHLYLPGIKLEESLFASADLGYCITKADFLVLAIPTQFLRSFLKGKKHLIPSGIPILNASKGLENSTLFRPSQIIEEETGASLVAAISGPNLSKEVAMGLPAASVIASRNAEAVVRLQDIFMSKYFRIYTSRDIIGVEIGGALKNVIAIAAGACDEMGLGNNAKSALMVRGITEISRLGIACGADPETFAGLSGIGDLITTCESELSRNHFVGSELAKGVPVSEILPGMKAVAEGVETARSAVALSKKLGIEMPITNEVHDVLFNGKDIKSSIASLMGRPPKYELR